jgi:hypothetical protein
MSRPIAASATVTTALLTNTRQLPRLDAASTFVLPCAPTEGRAAHDLIPQVRSSDSRRASRDIAGYSAWMRAETIAATQKATIIDDNG